MERVREFDGQGEPGKDGEQVWAVVVWLGGIEAGLGRAHGELQDEHHGGPDDGLSALVAEESELGEDGALVEEVVLPRRQVEEVQSLRQVCPAGKDPLLLLPPRSLLGEETHCSRRCSL